MNFRKLLRKATHTRSAIAITVSISSGVSYAQCNDFSNEIDTLDQMMALACSANEQFASEDNWAAASCAAWDALDAAGIPTSGVELWNALANNGSLTIGARILTDGIRADGNLYQGTKKTFIIEDIIDNDFQLDIEYEQGQADLEVSVCHIDDDGSKSIVASYEDESRAGLNRSVDVEETGMYAIMLKARSTGLGVQRYDYEITVDVSNQTVRRDRKYGKIDPDKVGKKSSGKIPVRKE